VYNVSEGPHSRAILCLKAGSGELGQIRPWCSIDGGLSPIASVSTRAADDERGMVAATEGSGSHATTIAVGSP
jgi:hypothetical protein